MSTFKTAMRVLRAKKVYLIVYLVWLSIMVFAMAINPFSSISNNEDHEFHSVRPEVAVVDRDHNREGFASALEKNLKSSCDLVSINTSSEGLQKAVASNYADLIVIIPDGFARGLTQAVTHGAALPQVETVTSFTGAYGTLANIQVDNFIHNVVTQASAESEQGASHALQSAFKQVNSTQNGDGIQTIAVGEQSSSDLQLRETFASTVKLCAYPLFMTVAICCAVMLRVFQTADIRKRMYLAPQQYSRITMQQFAACSIFAVACSLLLTLGSLAMATISGVSLAALGVWPVCVCFISMLLYSLMAVAFGFMICACGLPESFMNGIVNTIGLVIMFTSGQAFPQDMMPQALTVLGKLLPGWWYCRSIDNIFGVTTATHVDWNAWANNSALVVLFGIAFLFVGLAAFAIRRARPSVAASSTTQLAS